MKIAAWVAVAVLALGLSTDAAEARRKLRMPVIVPLGGGGGSSLVRVLDLPDIDELRREDGRFVDLGYHFTGPQSGSWVGYVGADEFLSLDEEKLATLMRIGGLSELPPVPERPASNSGYVIFALVALGLVAKLFKMIGGGTLRLAGVAGAAARKRSEAGEDAAWMAGAEEAIARAKTAAASAGPAPRTAAVARAGMSRTPTVTAGRSSFGRRAT